MLVYGLRQPGVHRSYASAISGLKHRLAPDVAISCRSERLRFDIVAFCHVQAASPEMTAQKERPLSGPIFGEATIVGRLHCVETTSCICGCQTLAPSFECPLAQFRPRYCDSQLSEMTVHYRKMQRITCPLPARPFKNPNYTDRPLKPL